MGDPHHEFPQPTRPILSYDAIPNPENLEERNYQEFQCPEMLEIPKQTQPRPSSQENENQSHVSFSEPTMDSVRYFDDSCESSSKEKTEFSPSTGKTPKGEKEVVDELLRILVECMEELNTRNREALLKKFFLEIEKEERLERFIVQRLRQSRVKALSELCEKVEENIEEHAGDIEKDYDDLNIPTRSLHESVEELSEKLEKFKVRTFDAGEVVIKEDENSK